MEAGLGRQFALGPVAALPINDAAVWLTIPVETGVASPAWARNFFFSELIYITNSITIDNLTIYPSIF